MTIALKELSSKAKEISSGAVQLADGLVKKTLLCRTGQFNGMFGPVTVSEKTLKGIAERYNADRASVQNENDYAPILKDHERKVDNVLGRVMAGLYTESWTNPENGEVELGLYGDLRIDDPEAKKNVELGKYAHVSISFDEETFELFEVSFVAVEAAKRSIVLSQGGTMNLESRLSTLAQKHKALAATVKTAHENRKVSLAKIAETTKKSGAELKELSKKMQEISLGLKTSQVKAAMLGFVKQGKMTPVELKETDLKAMAALSADVLKIVLSSYEKRSISPDVIQFGKSGEGPVKTDITNKEAMREAMELQRSGKKATALADAPEHKPEENPDKKLAKPEGEEEDSKEIDMEEMKKHLDALEAAHAHLLECHSKLEAMHGDTEKLAEGEKEQEKEEEKHLSEEDSKEGEIK